jgi:addiction module HigA family antidote
MYNPPHPGRIVRDAIQELKMTVTEFADHIGVSRVTVSRVVNEKAGISPDMSIRLSEAFNQSQPDIWLLMQTDYDFWQASQVKRKKVKPLRVAVQHSNEKPHQSAKSTPGGTG